MRASRRAYGSNTFFQSYINITIRTLAQKTTSSGGLTEFAPQSLSTDETFQIKNALIVPEFTDNEGTLPHVVKVENLEHFQGATIPVIAQRKASIF